MGLTSLQSWMDPSDWLQGAMSEDGGIESSSPSSVDMLGACSRPLMERRLRPPHDHAPNCPRCDSTNTKFCYYNNYSLSQPRYFCKTCRRYWTKGGTLRNIPVGGGCRKNKKSSSSSSSSSSKKPNVVDHLNSSVTNSHQGLSPTDLHLSFPEVQLPHHLTGGGLIGAHGGGLATTFLDNKYNALLDRPNIGFLESKLDALVAHNVARGHDLLGPTNFGVDFGIGLDHHSLNGSHNNYHVGLGSSSNNLYVNALSSSSPFGAVVGGNGSNHVLDNTYQRLMLPYDYNPMSSNDNGHPTGLIDVKPNTKLLSLEWQGNNDNGGVNGLSSWGSGSMLNGYITPSTTNSLL